MLKNPLHVYGEGALNVPSHLNFGQYVDTLWSYGDKTALINGTTHEKLSYRNIVKDAMKIALSLTRMGVKRGDTVAIYSENRKEFWSTFIGITCTGATFTPISTAYTKDELKYLLNISKPNMIFCSPFAYKSHGKTLRNLPFVEKIILFGQDRATNTLLYDDVAKVPSELNWNVDKFVAADVIGQTDTAVILYSSGTTGLPKGVMLTHLNVILTCKAAYTMNPLKLSLMIAPWCHTLGLMGVLGSLTTGGTVVYLPKFESDLYLKTIEKYRIVQILVPPPVLVALCKIRTNYDVSSVEMVYSGAAPLKTDTIEAIKNRFPNVTDVLQGYGMTECTLGITKDVYDKPHLAKIGGVGRPISVNIVKIVDIETRKPLGVNQTGEICVKGSVVMKGYVGRNISDDLDDEGFFKTGDIGYYDEDKCFFVVDRLKELIKYNGYQVPPAEIEAVLLQHTGILDAAVIGIPHDSAGEVPRAYVVLQPMIKLSEEEIKSFVAEKLSYQKHLRGGVHFVNEIPKSPSGKILRKKLREMAKKTEIKSKL